MYGVYGVSVDTPARWLVKKFKTYKEVIEFLRNYPYDANVIDGNGNLILVKFDGRIIKVVE